MKKFYFIVLIGIFFLISGEISKSAPNISCPSGYTHYSRTVTITVGGTTCNYIIDICVLCENVTHIDSLTIILKAFRTLDTCNQDPNLVHAAIYDLILSTSWINTNIPFECFTGFKPCNEGYTLITGIDPVCWKKVGYLDDENNLKIAYVGCYENCECITIYEICWDGRQYVKRIHYGPFIAGNCACSQVEPPDPTAPDEETDCFYLDGPCYP
ncbi:MAG: hypothetical protein A2X64_07285 [Ignavibacteria bacterium GWF2_33_9]|nr:MAG: hypothetical protein A2X64_07285 [Ignavibacteria bacterium GWF2_33_9]